MRGSSSRSTWWPSWRSVNPFDFFLEPRGRAVPVRVRAVARARARAVPERGSRAAARRMLAALRPQPRAHRRLLVDLNRRCRGGRLRDPHGTGRADARGDARARLRLVPGFELAARAAAAPAGLAARFVSGYLIQLEPDQKPLDGPRAGARFHRSARVGRGLSARRGLDRPRSDLEGLLAGEGHIPLACTPDPPRAAPIKGGVVDRSRGRVRVRDAVERVVEIDRASPSPTRRAVGAHRRARRARRSQELSAATCGSRWAASRRSSAVDDLDGAEWNHGAGPASGARRAAAAPAANRLAPAAFSTRPGQVVSGRAAAALGARVLWRTTACRSGATRS